MANIKFKTLQLHNFMSFAEAEINLDNLGYVLISGINNNPDDLAASNGSGKSSIAEAIIWSLTGETIRGIKNIANININQGAFVKLVFDVDKDTYKIIRYKDDPEYGTNLKVYINNEDKSGKGIRDTEKLLEQYLPDLTSSLIGSVIILGQGLPQRFTNNSPSGRKEVLEKLAKSDFMIEDIKNKLFTRKVYLQQELRKYEDSILGNENKQSVYELQLKDMQDRLNTFIPQNWDSIIAQNENKLKILEKENLYLESDKNFIQNNLNTNKVTYQNSINEKNNQVNDFINKCNIKYNDYKINLVKLESDIDSLSREINKLDSIKDTCPTCGQKLPNIHKVDTSDLKKQKKNLLEEKSIKEKELKDIQKEDDKELDLIKANYTEILSKINSLIILDEQKYNKFIEDIRNKVIEINSIKTEIIKLKTDKEDYNNKRLFIESNIKDINDKLEEIKKILLYNNIEKENNENHLNIVNKMITIATRDFRGFLLSNAITFIEQRAKEYCLDILGTTKISFMLDGNNINISYCDRSYESLSGGEKQKVDLIIQFSIRDMLSHFLNFSSNILVLDELFDNLDFIGCQKLLNLLSNKFNDISSIFIITHRCEELAIPYDNVIKVIKNKDGISKVEK